MSKCTLPQVESTNGGITIQNDYWVIRQDLQQGGAIQSIIFHNGSGKNLLQEPVSCYVDTLGDPLSFMSAGTRPGCGPEDALFSSIYDQNPKVEIDSLKGFPVITILGELKNSKGEGSGIHYQERSEYHAFYVRKKLHFTFTETRKDIYAMGVAKLVIDRSLQEFGAKCSVWQMTHGGNQMNAGKAFYGTTQGSVYPAYVERYPFRWLALFSRGEDAIEVLPSGSLQAWEEGVCAQAGFGRFALYTLENPHGSSILLEPYRELTSGYPDPAYHRPELHGSYDFSYTIGLPGLEKHCPADIRHTGFNNHPWPSNADIQNWVEHGITVARLHNDFHNSGDFWHDGTFPPYDQKGIEQMQEVISQAHAAGIKVIPYFSLAELHPQSAAWQAHHEEWKRTSDDQDTEMHNYWQNGEYGSQMCLASGWGDYLKEYIQKILATYHFDGVYFDWVSSLFCNNRRHCGHDHITSDQILEFLEWTREFLGPERVLIIHTSGSPYMAAESYADATIVFEEIYGPPALLTEPPLVDYFQPQMDMAECIQRLLCPSILAFKGEESARKFVANEMAAGLISYLGQSTSPEHPLSKNFHRLKNYHLDQYTRLPALRAPVRTESEDVRAAIFYNDREILLIPANVNRPEPVQSRIFLELKQLPGIWNKQQNFQLLTESGERIFLTCADLESKGIQVDLDAYAYQIWKLQPAE